MQEIRLGLIECAREPLQGIDIGTKRSGRRHCVKVRITSRVVVGEESPHRPADE
jgi:hypothetical protein